MKKGIKFLMMIVISFFVSYYTSVYFGNIYNLLPQVWGGGWIGSESSWNLILGLPLALIFFITFLSYRFVFDSKKSVLILLSPLFLYEAIFDFGHLYLPIILVILAFVLNKLIYSLVIRKN